MSNRLTFSLASLILVCALVLGAGFVDEAHAQADFGTASIADQVYTEAIEITDLVLPTATNADGYTLEPTAGTGTGALTGFDGLSFDATTRTISGTPTVAANRLLFTYTAVDDDGDNAVLTFTIEVKANTAPAFADNADIDDQVIKIGKDINITNLPEATDDDDGDTIHYNLSFADSGGLPAGMLFDPIRRQIFGRVSAAGVAGQHSLAYTAEDLANNVATIEFVVTVEVDAEPTFGNETIPDMVFKVGEVIEDKFLPEATDTNTGDELTHTLAPSLPAGLEYIQSARLLRGTPTAVKAKTEYTYTVTDPDGNTAELTFNLTVRTDPCVCGLGKHS